MGASMRQRQARLAAQAEADRRREAASALGGGAKCALARRRVAAERERALERLRREAMRMERCMADERRKAERAAKAERKAMGREIRQLERQVNQCWQEELGELKNEIKQLRKLTDLMVAGDRKRARHE